MISIHIFTQADGISFIYFGPRVSVCTCLDGSYFVFISVSFKSMNQTLRFPSRTRSNTGSNVSTEMNPTTGSAAPEEMSIQCGRFHPSFLSLVLIWSNTWHFSTLLPLLHGVLCTSTFHTCYQPFLSNNNIFPPRLFHEWWNTVWTVTNWQVGKIEPLDPHFERER